MIQDRRYWKLFFEELYPFAMYSTTNNKKMKISIVSWVLFFLIVLAVFLIGYFKMGWFSIKDEQLLSFAQQVKSYGADIMVYGNMPDAQNEEIPFRRLDSISDAELSLKGIDGYHAIVLFDVDGKMNVSTEELMLIKEYCQKHFFDMIYLGYEHMDSFREVGFYYNDIADERSFMYQGYQFRNGTTLVFDETNKCWVDSTTGDFNSNPYMLWGPWHSYDYPGNNAKPQRIWKSVLGIILYSIEN